MTKTALNHVSVVASDLEESVAFYEEVFGMERIPSPNFSFEAEWLEMDNHQLHLFDLDVEAPTYHHFGVLVDDLEAVYQEAKARGALTDFIDDEDSPRMYILPDNALQMYVEDPDGNVIEVNWPDVDTLDEEIHEQLTDRETIRPQTGEAAESSLGLDRFDLVEK